MLLDAVDQAVIATDLSGRVVYWGRFAEELYGWSAQEAIGEPVLRLTTAQAVHARAAEIMEQLARGERWSGEFEVCRKDGSTFFAHVTDSPIHNARGELIGVVGISFDATEWRRNLSESKRLRDEANSAAHEREEIVAVVSHDLRNPLHAIEMASALLATGSLPPDARERQIDLIRRAASRMTRLIEDLTDVARLRTGKLGISCRRVNPAQLLAEAAAFHTPSAEAKGLEIVAADGAGLPTVLADRGRVLQVFSNLLDNAIALTAPGGLITLDVSLAGDDVWFLVSDTGPGIGEDEIGHVFEHRWRAPSNDARGAGLGLWISKGIVEAHGGSIRAESTPGSGATFSFSLPAVRGTSPLEGPAPEGTG